MIKRLGTDTFTILIFFEEVDLKQIIIKTKIFKKRFKNINFIKINTNIEDWEQMLIMSNCAHHIIANSSFSWWGAYFNLNKNKIVLYPDIWFGKKLNHDTSDLCHPSWNKISSH